MSRCTFCDCMNPADATKCVRCGAELAGTQDEGGVDPPASPLPGDVESKIEELLRARQKIEAIKIYRQSTVCGLKEAKDAVEAIERKLGIPSSGAGCAGMLVLGLLAAWSLIRTWI